MGRPIRSLAPITQYILTSIKFDSMRKYTIIFNLILAFGLISCSKDKAVETVLEFKTFDHYFVKNTFHIDPVGSFLEAHDSASFYKVFAEAATMDEITWIVPSDFNDKFVISVVKHFGNNRYDLKITKISFSDRIVRVYYSYNLIEKNLSFSSTGNLIAMIKTLSYDAIQFYENGKFVR